MLLIQGASVYAPSYQGELDVMVAAGQIVLVEADIKLSGVPHTLIDGRGFMLTPGLVDPLTHIIGGGGEGGFHTRTPEMKLTDALRGGVTTVNGALGTDSVTRTHADLLAKARALKNEGLNAVCMTGSYQIPSRTLTGSVERDIIFIDEFIGVGEVAVADSRGSQPTVHELGRLASEARVAGLIAGKKGAVLVHVGPEPEGISILSEVIDKHAVRCNQFYPTHMNRNKSLFESGLNYCRRGGVIDFTASTIEQLIATGEIRAAEAVALSLEAGISASSVSMSTDGHASLPEFDEQGILTGLGVGRMDSIYEQFTYGVLQCGVSIDQMLQTVTSTPAAALGLSDVGSIALGKRADLLLIEKDSMKLDTVICGGRVMVSRGELLVKGIFES